jgi:uncharacterized protein YciI
MLFAFICKDKPGKLQLRLDLRPDHVIHLETLNQNGTLKFAGPFLGEDGKSIGSLVVVEAADAAQAKSIADSDPFAKGGLFESVEIHPWNWTFNNPANPKS